MQAYLTEIKIGLLVGLIAILAWGEWKFVADGYKKQIAVMESTAQKAKAEFLLQQAVLTQKAQAQHEQDQLNVNSLYDDLQRVRLHVPASSCISTPDTNQDGASGVAPSRIDTDLAEAQQAIAAIGERCAQLNIDAIALNKTLEP